jgi:hypothetical protein
MLEMREGRVIVQDKHIAIVVGGERREIGPRYGFRPDGCPCLFVESIKDTAVLTDISHRDEHLALGNQRIGHEPAHLPRPELPKRQLKTAFENGGTGVLRIDLERDGLAGQSREC